MVAKKLHNWCGEAALKQLGRWTGHVVSLVQVAEQRVSRMSDFVAGNFGVTAQGLMLFTAGTTENVVALIAMIFTLV